MGFKKIFLFSQKRKYICSFFIYDLHCNTTNQNFLKISIGLYSKSYVALEKNI